MKSLRRTRNDVLEKKSIILRPTVYLSAPRHHPSSLILLKITVIFLTVWNIWHIFESVNRAARGISWLMRVSEREKKLRSFFQVTLRCRKNGTDFLFSSLFLSLSSSFSIPNSTYNFLEWMCTSYKIRKITILLAYSFRNISRAEIFMLKSN